MSGPAQDDPEIVPVTEHDPAVRVNQVSPVAAKNPHSQIVLAFFPVRGTSLSDQTAQVGKNPADPATAKNPVAPAIVPADPAKTKSQSGPTVQTDLAKGIGPTALIDPVMIDQGTAAPTMPIDPGTTARTAVTT